MKSGLLEVGKRSLLLFLLVFGSLSVFAQKEAYRNSLSGYIKAGDSCVVTDDKFEILNTAEWNKITHIKVLGGVSLSIRFDTLAGMPQKPFKAELLVDIYYWTQKNQEEPSKKSNVSLRVEFDTAKYKMIKTADVHEVPDAHKIAVVVKKVKSELFPDSLPVFFRLKNEIIVTRQYPFDPHAPIQMIASIPEGRNLGSSGSDPWGDENGTEDAAVMAPSNMSMSESLETSYPSPDCDHPADVLNLSWQTNIGSVPVEYDLEYAFIDFNSYFGHMMQNSPGAVTQQMKEEIFRFNGTRVTLREPQTYYSINMVFEKGFLLCRIRGVGYHTPNLSEPDFVIRNEGDWFYSVSGMPVPTAGGWWVITDAPGSTIKPMEPCINWQYNASFAENGTRKEVVSYFDGKLHNRQTVTINNNDLVAVVQETVLDEFGRPAVSILPAPVSPFAYQQNWKFQYFRGFNRNQWGVAYSHQDIIYNDCGVSPIALSNTSGAGSYYSPTNGFRTLYSGGTALYPEAPFIPNAEGYPFAVTQYTDDQTGRVRRQGGVGSTFQVGGNHDTRYFYGKPTQYELDRLFGSEAGNASHYLKNMVLDPNGQVSVSYINSSGKTIATALAGGIPENLDALAESPSAVTVTNTLIRSSDLSYDASVGVILGTSTFLAPLTGVYSISYQLEELRYYVKHHLPTLDQQLCFTCYYDIEITVRNSCGVSLLRNQDGSPLESFLHAAGASFNDLCNTTPQHLNGSLPVHIQSSNDIGECNVTYKLVLSKEAERYYTNVHWENNTDLRRFESFLYQFLDQARMIDCYSDCEACEELSDGKAAFVAEMRDYIEKLVEDRDEQYIEVNSTALETYLENLYDQLVLHCSQVAPIGSCSPNPCEERLQLIIHDVTPGGQYALFDPDTYALLDPQTNVLNYFNQRHVKIPGNLPLYTDASGNQDWVYNVAGQLVKPEELSLAEFIQQFRASWAKSLAYWHPEYCYYEWCGMNLSSRQFDVSIKEMSATHAFTEGYINRLDPVALLDKDPFFNTQNSIAGLGVPYYNAMRWELENHSKTVVYSSHVTRNILEFIDISLYCADKDINNICFIEPDCRRNNREWEMYVGLYLQLKQKYDEMARLCWQPGCLNCYIGPDLLTETINGAVPNGCQIDYPSSDWTDLLPACGVGLTCEEAIGGITVSNSSAGNNCYEFNAQLPPGVSIEVRIEYCPGDPAYVFEEFGFLTGGQPLTICPGSSAQVPQGCGVNISYQCNFPSASWCMPASCPTDSRSISYANKRRVFYDYRDDCSVAKMSCFDPSSSDAMVEQVVEENCIASADNLINELISRDCSSIQSFSSAQLDDFRTALVLVCKTGGLDYPPNAMGILELKRPHGTSNVGSGSGLTFTSFDQVIDHYLGAGTSGTGCSSDLIGLPYPHDRQTYLLTKPLIRSTNQAICDQLNTLYNKCWQKKGLINPEPTDDEFYSYLLGLMDRDFDLSKEEVLMLRSACNSLSLPNCGYPDVLLEYDVLLPAALAKADGCKDCAEIATAEAGFSIKYPSLAASDPQFEVLFKNYMNHVLGYTLSFMDYHDFKILCEGTNTTHLLLCDKAATRDEPIELYSCLKDNVDGAFVQAQQRFWQYKEQIDNEFRIAYRTVCSKPRASLMLTQPFQEYHYTLYYYDQAGNLVKTVPPAGVRPLSDVEVAGIEHEWQNSDIGRSALLGPHSVSFGDGSFILHDFTVSYSLKPLSWSAGSNTILEVQSGRYMIDANSTVVEQLNLGYHVLNQQFVMNFTEIDGGAGSYTTSIVHFNIPGLAVNQWTKLALSRKKGMSQEFTLYLDGIPYPGLVQSIASTAITGTVFDDLNALTSLYSGPSQVLCKDLKVFNRSMPAIEAWYNAQTAFALYSSTGLLHWLRMDEGAGTHLANNVGSIPGSASSALIWNDDVTFVPTKHLFVTSYAYNSLNQVRSQNTPDGGTAQFWYDRLGRLVISQNAEQLDPSGSDAPNRFSYTKYDALGRIIEVGEKVSSNLPVDEADVRNNQWLFGLAFDVPTGVCGLQAATTQDPTNCGGWYNSGSNRQMTITRYGASTDAADHNYQIDLGSVEVAAIVNEQQHLRNRVAATFFLDEEGGSQQFASFYTYDIAGNVSTLWQQLVPMKNYDGLGVKRIDYQYDLISGKVNEVWYQRGKKDQFYYRYYYDIENRLREAWSGCNDDEQTQLKLDASYKYYLHGPLARMELGHVDKKLQGVDYAYTIQGWLKGINGSVLNPNKEMGRDGGTSPNQYFGRDAFSMVLHYYQNDYKSVLAAAQTACFMNYGFSDKTETVGRPLYNGNIAAMSVSLKQLNGGSTTGYSYGYDQLNRLLNMRKHVDGISDGQTTLSWNAGSIDPEGRYMESYGYDANGNIQNLFRNGAKSDLNPLEMDNLEYWYYYMNKTTGLQVYNKANMPDLNEIEYLTNRLAYVTDGVSDGKYSIDIDNQGAQNYQYDRIGNLVSDNAEGISQIKWNVYGKISQINKSNTYPNGNVSTQMDYFYDVSGQRVMKKVNDKVSFYIRDASGNVMAIYDAESEDGYTWQEQHLYGSSRLGMYTPRQYIAKGTIATTPQHSVDPDGKRTYELSNHLGNVMVTISDKKIEFTENGTTFFLPEILSTSDYYPFGMLMPERHGFKTEGGWSVGNDMVNGNTVSQTLTLNLRNLPTPEEYIASKFIEFVDGFESLNMDEFEAYIADETNTSAGNPGGSGGENNGYRYGFNGQEMDNEIQGLGNTYTAEFWSYDSRLGRRWNIDPVVKENESPYLCFSGNPILIMDPDGDDGLTGNSKERRSVNKYERKFERMKNRLERQSGQPVQANQVHAAMEARFNNRKWMWIKAKTSMKESELGSSGTGTNGVFYFHAGDIFRYNEAVANNQPLTTTVQVTNNIPLVRLSFETPIAGTATPGGLPRVGASFRLPSNGTVTFNLRTTPFTFNYTLNQSNLIIANIGDLAGSLQLNNVSVPANATNQTISSNVNLVNGNVITLVSTFADVSPPSNRAGTFSGTPQPVLTVTTTQTVSLIPQRHLIHMTLEYNPHKLNKTTRKILNEKRNSPIVQAPF